MEGGRGGGGGGGGGGTSFVLIPGAEMEGGRGALLCPNPWS